MRALLLVAVIGASSPAWAETVEIDFGSVVLVVSDSTTAQVFHIVDQLSEWDAFTHRQYGRWARTALTRDQEYRRLLQQHAELRRARGRGKGFEEAFLVEDSIAAAADRAGKSGVLSPAEAAAERVILEYFAPLVAGLIAERRESLLSFRSRLLGDRERLRPWIDRLVRLAELKGTIRVPVFLIANPDPSGGGGGANGGRLVVELPSPDPASFLLHETLHVVLAPHAATIRAAAESAALSGQTLNEAIAYAFAPGLTGEAGRDLLAEGLAGYMIRGTPATDAYAQYHMMAAVIRPLLRAALDNGEPLGVFLGKAVERWRTIAPR
jgi:hypothetical protein